jgi:NTP pyrophosphatase (non-canonical NTP hydrolase)
MYPITKERLETYLNGTVLRTANFGENHRENITLGLYGEAGEICDDIKKYYFHGSLTREQARERLVKEAGDWIFYYTWLCYSIAETVQQAYESNRTILDLVYDDFYVPALDVAAPDIWLAPLLGQYAAGKRGWHYLYCLLQNWEISIEEVLLANEAKLAERHPNGWQGGKKES